MNRVYGLVGYPLKHSFSARFFNDKFHREGIDAEYHNFELEDIGLLPELLQQEKNICGLNVTIPYKEKIIPLLTSVSPEAQSVGAVNVVQIERDGETVRLQGYNTDVIGFRKSIEPLLRSTHQSALILGTGGAAKAVVFALKQLGLATQLVSRTAKAGCMTYGDLTPELMGQYQVIVNCTPLGMFPNEDGCPEIPYEAISTQHLLYDLVYNPAETLFLRQGRQQGALTKNGLEMLHLQALASWQLWR